MQPVPEGVYRHKINREKSTHDTKVDNNKNNPSNTSKSDNKTTTKVDNTKKAAKTGDTTNVAVWAFALAASAAAAGVVVKRKKEN